jgi:hypothetical protein
LEHDHIEALMTNRNILIKTVSEFMAGSIGRAFVMQALTAYSEAVLRGTPATGVPAEGFDSRTWGQAAAKWKETISKLPQ